MNWHYSTLKFELPVFAEELVTPGDLDGGAEAVTVVRARACVCVCVDVVGLLQHTYAHHTHVHYVFQQAARAKWVMRHKGVYIDDISCVVLRFGAVGKNASAAAGVGFSASMFVA